MTLTELQGYINQAATDTDDKATVRIGYLQNVQEQKTSFPLVVYNPPSASTSVLAVGSSVKDIYTFDLFILAPDDIQNPTDKRAAGRSAVYRSDIYAQVDGFRVDFIRRFTKLIGSQSAVMDFQMQPVQTVGTQVYTGQVVSFRIPTIHNACI
jgi:hypothetical protein